MKILKKISAILLSAAMIFTAFPVAFAGNSADYANSDCEGYFDGLFYCAGNEKDPRAYRETAIDENREYLTSYAVDSVALYDGYLYAGTGTSLRRINIDTLADEKVYDSRAGIDAFALSCSKVYMLINGSVVKLNEKDGSLTTAVASGKITSFWFESANMLCYMTDEEMIYYYNLFSGKTSQEKNNATDLGDYIPLYGSQIPSGTTNPEAMGLGSLQGKFPAGRYWNHGSGANNPDGTTGTGCYHHSGNCDYGGSCGCNSFLSAIQCMGYAYKCGYDVYGTYPTGWSKSTSSSSLNNVKAGDVIRYRNDGHSIFVTGVSGNTVYFTDCNWDGHCGIRWGASVTKSTLKSSFTSLRSAPYEAPGGGSPQVTYTITFNANGGSVSPSTAQYKGGDKYGDTPVPEREGYDFLGWFTDAQAGTQIKADDKVSASITVYAHWQLKTYTVTFDKTGGNYAPADFTIDYFSSKVIENAKTPTKEGYTFVCWNTAIDGSGTSYKPGDRYSAHESVTLYAIWKGKSIQIHFDPNGGSLTGASYKAVTYGDPFGELPVPVRTGYTFKGWHLGSATGELVTENTIVNISSSQRLYASWEETVYTVTYNANGGENAPAQQTKTYGRIITLSSTIPVRAHYTFTGWFTSSAGTGTKYDPGDTYSDNADIVLYAGWEGDKYTITFNPNGGTNPPANATKTHGTDLTLPKDVPSMTGFDFVAWNTKQDGTGTSYKAGAKYTKEGNATLYAIWEVAKYRVTYDACGGENAPETQVFIYNSSTVITDKVPSRTGFDFMGWFTQPDGGGRQYTAGETYAENADLPLYACWQRERYAVTFNPGGGTGQPTNQYKEYELDYTVPDTIPVRPGYRFDGWRTSAGAEYAPGDVYKENAPLTLYAQWTAETYMVTFNSNGAGIAETRAQYTYATLYPALPELQRNGYTFKGWFTQPSGGSQIKEGGRVSITSDSVFYAHWSANTYTVTFNPAGGQCSESEKTVTYGSAYGTLPAASKQGYYFAGWFDKDGRQITETSKVDFYQSGEVLTAKYVAGTYTVILDPAGGTCDTVSLQRNYTEKLGTLPVPVRSGCEFTGWQTSGGVTVTSDYAMPGHDLTLRASWRPASAPSGENPDSNHTLTWRAGESEIKETYYYGQDIEIPKFDIPAGYTVSGYDKAVPARMPDSDLEITAVITPVEYTAVFIDGGSLWAKETYTVKSESLPSPALPSKDGYTVSWEQKAPAPGGVSVHAVYTPVIYTATFFADGNQVKQVQFTVEDDFISEPAVPAKKGYTGHWSDYSLIPGDITINAVYDPNTYTVTFYNAGSVYATVDYVYGAKSITEPAFPHKEGYNGRWSTYTLGPQDTVSHAVYNPIEYTATYMVEGTVLAKVKFTVERPPVEPPVPPRTGYFAKWNPYTLTAADITITAKYIPNSTVIILNYTQKREIDYLTTITLRSFVSNAPDEYEIHWFVNGHDEGTGNGDGTFTMKEATGDFEIYAVVYSDGEYSDPSQTETVDVNTGFFSRIKGFFRRLFRRPHVITQ